MENKELKSILQDALDREFPASQIDLLPTLKERLVAGQPRTSQQGEKMNTVHSRRMPRLALAALVALLLVAFTFLTPQGRAFAQSVLQFFRRAESNVLPLPTEQIVSPESLQGNPTAQPPSPFMSREEAERQAGFTAQVLPLIPDGLQFVGALASPGTISFQYQALGGGGALIINESPSGFIQSEWDQAPAESIAAVKVGEIEAEIVQGAFVVYPGETSARWNPEAPILRLRWIKDGIWFEMARFGGVESIAYLDREALIGLAESMTSDPFPMDMSHAAAQVSFEVLEPAVLPEGLTFYGAAFDPPLQMVSLSYGYSPDDGRLLIKQQPANNRESCQLCGMVGASATVESVQIADAAGEYALGVWQLTDQGPVWKDDPYLKTLRWQKRGIAYELIYMGTESEKEELIRVAESMKPVAVEDRATPVFAQQGAATEGLQAPPESDPALLTGLTDAKRMVTFAIKVLPSTPAGMVFDSVTATSGSVNIRYRSLEPGAGTLSIGESLGEENWRAYPAEAIRKVTVHGVEAELIRGAKVRLPGAASSTWSPDANVLDLRWVENGVRFSLLLTGGGSGSLSHLDEKALLALAESMVNVP